MLSVFGDDVVDQVITTECPQEVHGQVACAVNAEFKDEKVQAVDQKAAEVQATDAQKALYTKAAEQQDVDDDAARKQPEQLDEKKNYEEQVEEITQLEIDFWSIRLGP